MLKVGPGNLLEAFPTAVRSLSEVTSRTFYCHSSPSAHHAQRSNPDLRSPTLGPLRRCFFLFCSVLCTVTKAWRPTPRSVAVVRTALRCSLGGASCVSVFRHVYSAPSGRRRGVEYVGRASSKHVVASRECNVHQRRTAIRPSAVRPCAAAICTVAVQCCVTAAAA